MKAFTDTFVRLRGTPSVSPYSGQATGDLDWSDPDRKRVFCVDVQPDAGTEDSDRQQQEVFLYSWRALGFPDIQPADRITWRGATYTIEGTLNRWPGRGGYTAGKMRLQKG